MIKKPETLFEKQLRQLNELDKQILENRIKLLNNITSYAKGNSQR